MLVVLMIVSYLNGSPSRSSEVGIGKADDAANMIIFSTFSSGKLTVLSQESSCSFGHTVNVELMSCMLEEVLIILADR